VRLALLTVVALLALPGAAEATIVPQRGMIGVELGNTVREVRDAKGAPDGIVFVQNEIIGRQRLYRYGKTWVGFDGDGVRAKVINLTTTARGERLANGLGVGSAKRELMAKLTGETCPVDEAFHCYLGRFEPGRRITDFRLSKRGVVRSVTVGIVVD
jgi:hypothetical protein